MASSSVPTNPTSHNVASILPKLGDADPDIRYMTLNDLNKMLEIGHATFLTHDYTTCTRIVDGLLNTLNDTNGDVQNMAIKTLGSFIPKAPETILSPTIEKVSNIKTDNTIDTTVAALAVRAIVVSLAQPVPGVPRTPRVTDSYNAVSKALIPRLVGRFVVPNAKGAAPRGMLQEDIETGNDSNSLDLLSEVARCFGSMLQEPEVAALEQITVQVLQSERCGSVMKKKAVAALSALAPFFDDALLSKHVSHTIEQLRGSHLTHQQRKLHLTVLGSLARSIPQKFGPYLTTLAPFVLSPLSQEELDQQREEEAENYGERDTQVEEVREAALVAIESFLHVCAHDMRTYTRDVIQSAARFLRYEPNVAEDDDDEEMGEEDQEDDEIEVEEDFEEETGFEDEDDVSWKVRRGSAKVLHALIQTLDPTDPLLYSQIAPALVARFTEREESVRTEVLGTLAFLIRRTQPTAGITEARRPEQALPQSRKRRRGLSDSFGPDFRTQQPDINGSSASTPHSVSDATQSLIKLTPDIVKGAAQLLKSSTPNTKQVVISLLRDLVTVEKGGLADHPESVIDPVIDAISTAGGSNVSNVEGNTLRVESLRLLRAIADTHSKELLQPHLSSIIKVLVQTSRDRFTKVALESLSAVESFVGALTAQQGSRGERDAHYVSDLYRILVDRVSASDTDTEVRQKAISALGFLIGRTSSSAAAELLSQEERYSGQQVISERLRNELTRLASVRAVDAIAVLSRNPQDFQPQWITSTALELGAQLNKSSRSLRGASLNALRMLALNPASRESMDQSVVTGLIDLLTPLLKTDDLHMMSSALIVLSAFARTHPALVATGTTINGICNIVTSPLSGTALDAVITCVESIGQGGAGKNLMKALLNVGVEGDTDVTGQVVGTLLVAGSGNLGVGLEDFVRELQTQDDDSKKCLALSVLGEVGLRLGPKSGLSPQSFIPYFDADSEKVKLAAAVALGRAGAGDVKSYLPVTLDSLSQGRQYFLLHAVKELLQHSHAEDEIKPFTKGLWQNIIAAGQSEDNKVVGAECIGRLAIIDPTAYLPQLQAYLQNSNPTIRGMVISALRYVFSDTDAAYDVHLQGTILPMLSVMLADTDLENQRLSLSTLNSAFHNKPDLVLPNLVDLLPAAIRATMIRPELVREVQMGPFKHKVDDGLEIRKSAYETLYALLEVPASRQRLDMVVFYDRIVAGIADEHEIKILCCLVLSKLMVLEPIESTRRLDNLQAQFRVVLSFKPKENAVKQELEKLAEQNKAIIKTSLSFNKTLATEDSKAWKDYFEWMRKEMPQIVKLAEDELKDGRDR